MPSQYGLTLFARKIQQLAQEVEINTNSEVIKAAGACLSTVIPATPVDTGRARGNWQVSLGEPLTMPREKYDKVGQVTIQEGLQKMSGRRQGTTIFITNNLHYIGLLNQGHSSQAPANFVELAVQAAIRNIKSARILRRF